MPCSLRFHRWFVAGILASALALSGHSYAQTHVVSPADLQKEITGAHDKRQQNLEHVNGFLSSDRAEAALKAARIDPQQVKTAVATLSDEELGQLASRAEKAQADFAAGTLSDHDLTLIILAIAILVLLIVAIRH